MFQPAMLDVAPGPAGIGLAAVVVIIVLGFIAMLAVGLVVFLWRRKYKMRDTRWPDNQPTAEPDKPMPLPNRER